MVVKSATKKKLMDLGFSEQHAHELAWERKWDDIKVLSPRNLLRILFGSKTWNEPDENIRSANTPNLNSRYPMGVTNDKHLTAYGKKNLDTVNEYYTKIHGIKEKTIETPRHRYGVINHETLFKRISYVFQTRYNETGELHTETILGPYYKENMTWMLPHTKAREHLQQKYGRYTDNAGNLH